MAAFKLLNYRSVTEADCGVRLLATLTVEFLAQQLSEGLQFF